jgi:hypothetical protein
LSISYVNYSPSNFASDFADPTQIGFDELYGAGGIFEVSYGPKYNFSLGSLTIEGAYGLYSNTTDDTSFGDFELTIQQIRLGVRFALDNMNLEPFIVPYVGAGGYVSIFREVNGGDSFNGQTEPAMYFLFGGQLQLNWLDKSGAVEAYADGGIENTFLFIEGRQYMASANAQDPDFGSNLNWSAGLSVEF